jgi:diguanylate cyclase (GGDEF)-like protein
MNQKNTPEQPIDEKDVMIDYLLAVLCARDLPQEIPAALKEDTAFQKLNACLKDTRAMVISLAEGNLSEKTVGSKGYVISHLKMLKANMRHLTWQTKRIACGDFDQKVEFMGEFSGAFNSMVEALAAMRAELEQLASIDQLTQVANRRHFFEIASLETERARRYKSPLSLLTMDLDHFKNINDTYGHHVGDRVLQMVAEIFRNVSRVTDTTGRIGGEEFAMILPNTDLSGARAAAEKVLTHCREAKLELEDAQVVTFTISIGIACLHEQDPDFERVMQRADTALYAAKKAGRDRLEVFE